MLWTKIFFFHQHYLLGIIFVICNNIKNLCLNTFLTKQSHSVEFLLYTCSIQRANFSHTYFLRITCAMYIRQIEPKVSPYTQQSIDRSGKLSFTIFNIPARNSLRYHFPRRNSKHSLDCQYHTRLPTLFDYTRLHRNREIRKRKKKQNKKDTFTQRILLAIKDIENLKKKVYDLNGCSRTRDLHLAE